MEVSFTDAQIEELRLILERQFHGPCNTEEARVTAYRVLEYYEVINEIVDADPEFKKLLEENPDLLNLARTPESPAQASQL